MQIFCPKCQAGYEIADELLKVKARRVKCGNCGEVFVVDKIEDISTEEAFSMLSKEFADEKETSLNQESNAPVNEDSGESVLSKEETEHPQAVAENDKAVEEEKTEPAVDDAENGSESSEPEDKDDDPIDIEDIFERLSERTENLIQEEKKLPFYKKIVLWIKNIFGLQFRINWKYVFITALFFGMIWMYNNRYDIVRSLPFMNSLYKGLGINAKIVGEGLEFQNISWNYVADGDEAKLDLRGFIFNQTDKEVVIPTVHVEILDSETELLQSQNRRLDTTVVSGGEKVPMSIIVTNPAPTMKYVYMTFIDVD